MRTFRTRGVAAFAVVAWLCLAPEAGVAQPAPSPAPAPTADANANLQRLSGGRLTGSGDFRFDGVNATPIGLSVTAADPDIGHNEYDRYGFGITVTTDSLGSKIGFTDENAAQISLTVTNGQAVYGSGTNAKKTFFPLSIALQAAGSGQRIGFGDVVNCFGMSDCAAESESVTYANGPIAGDEGEDLTVVNYVKQQGRLVDTTIARAPGQTSCGATVTQDVTASQQPQTVSVAGLAGCHEGDWVILNTEAPTPQPNQSAMQITGVGAASLSGVFDINLSRGETVTPAEVIEVANTYEFGQDRVLVDHSRASYSAGTVASISQADFIAAGAAWADDMVGGSPLDPGCVMLAADAYTGPPFSAGAGTLNSWYEIKRVSSPTRLTIFSTSVAGDARYHGRGPGDGRYAIAPCARVMRIIGKTVILNTNRFTWAVGDQVEQIITPYADSTGYQLDMGAYTNGVTLRGGYVLTNIGARTMSQGILLQSNMPQTGGADPYAWIAGMVIQNPQVGIVQFGGKSAYQAEGVTQDGFAAFTPGGALASGAGLFVGNFTSGAQLSGTRGHVFDITNTATGFGLAMPWPAFTANRTISFPDQSGTLALTLAGTTGRIGGAPLAAGSCAQGTVGVTGATTAMVATVSAAGGVDPGPAFMPRAYVSAPALVTVAVCALAAGTPTATTYNVRVLQ